MFTIISSWNIIEDEKKFCIMLPDIRKYSNLINNNVITKFRETLNTIKSKEPEYITAVLPDNITEKEYDLYQDFYNIELQTVKDMNVFNNDLFKKYLRNDKLYILNNTDICTITRDNIDIILIDDMNINKDNKKICDLGTNINNGKCYMEDIINVKSYFNKSIFRLLKSSLNNLHQNDDSSDVILVLGDLNEYDQKDMCDIITRLCKYNLLSSIICTDDKVYDYCKDTLKSNDDENTSMMSLDEELDDEDIHSLLYHFEDISLDKNVVLFMGTFKFKDDNSKDVWKKERELLYNLSVFDPYAYVSLLNDGNMKKDEDNMFRFTYDPISMLNMYLDMEEEQY